MASFTSAFTYTGHVAYRLKISPSSPAGTLLLSSISVTTNTFVCKCLQRYSIICSYFLSDTAENMRIGGSSSFSARTLSTNASIAHGLWAPSMIKWSAHSSIRPCHWILATASRHISSCSGLFPSRHWAASIAISAFFT